MENLTTVSILEMMAVRENIEPVMCTSRYPSALTTSKMDWLPGGLFLMYRRIRKDSKFRLMSRMAKTARKNLSMASIINFLILEQFELYNIKVLY